MTDTNRSKVYSHENTFIAIFQGRQTKSIYKLLFSFQGAISEKRSGDDTGVVTPVPIPNTEVKHSRAKNSYACHSESRTLPVCPGFGPGFFIAIWRSFPICILWMRFSFPAIPVAIRRIGSDRFGPETMEPREMTIPPASGEPGIPDLYERLRT